MSETVDKTSISNEVERVNNNEILESTAEQTSDATSNLPDSTGSTGEAENTVGTVSENMSGDDDLGKTDENSKEVSSNNVDSSTSVPPVAAPRNVARRGGHKNMALNGNKICFSLLYSVLI